MTFAVQLSGMKTDTLQIRLEPDLTALVNRAVRRTGLTKSEVLRQGLRRGVPEIVCALGGGPKEKNSGGCTRFEN
jgi:hypothetical protein